MIDTKNLRALAEAATPGPWRHNKDNEQLGDVVLGDSNYTVMQAMAVLGQPRQQRDVNAKFIAACSPDVVLALLDALERKDAALRCALDALQCVLAQTKCPPVEVDFAIEAINKELGQ